MRCTLTTLCLVAVTLAHSASASVFLPQSSASSLTASLACRSVHSSASRQALQRRSHLVKGRSSGSAIQQRATSNVGHSSMAMAIPGYGVAEQVFVGGFANFLSIYNFIITARILLSWFPQAAGVGALQPVYAITDPYLNLFRGIIPPIFGLDLSPILAFVTLNLLTNATAAVGSEIPEEIKAKLAQSKIKRGLLFGKKKQPAFPLVASS